MLGLLRDMRTRELQGHRHQHCGHRRVRRQPGEPKADVETMNLSSVDAPRDVSEVDYAGIATTPSDAGRAAAHRQQCR
jgi:hypothetical protein